jgi:hypothetical protein
MLKPVNTALRTARILSSASNCTSLSRDCACVCWLDQVFVLYIYTHVRVPAICFMTGADSLLISPPRQMFLVSWSVRRPCLLQSVPGVRISLNTQTCQNMFQHPSSRTFGYLAVLVIITKNLISEDLICWSCCLVKVHHSLPYKRTGTAKTLYSLECLLLRFAKYCAFDCFVIHKRKANCNPIYAFSAITMIRNTQTCAFSLKRRSVTRPHGAVSQKAVIFILAASGLRTYNLSHTRFKLFEDFLLINLFVENCWQNGNTSPYLKLTTSWSRGVVEKLIVAQPIKISPLFMEPDVSFPCSQVTFHPMPRVTFRSMNAKLLQHAHHPSSAAHQVWRSPSATWGRGVLRWQGPYVTWPLSEVFPIPWAITRQWKTNCT